jgi:predicted PurR-regulated permease PerM
MTELILASTVGILLISLPIGIYFIRQQQKLIKSLENRITKEQIESHTRVKLLEQRYDKLFALQNANLDKSTQQLQEKAGENLKELETRFKAFKNNFTNNY